MSQYSDDSTMSTETFTFFSDLPQEIQLHVWGFAIETSDDISSMRSVKLPNGQVIWRRGVTGPISGRRLSGLQQYWGIMRSCALARKLCLQHHKNWLVQLMEGWRTSEILTTQESKNTAIQRCAISIRDVDELIRRLNIDHQD